MGFATIVGFSRQFSPTHLLTSALPRSASLPSPNRFLLRSPLLAEKLLLLFRRGSVGRRVETYGWRSGCSICSFWSAIYFPCVLLCTYFPSISKLLLSCCLRLDSLGFLCSWTSGWRQWYWIPWRILCLLVRVLLLYGVLRFWNSSNPYFFSCVLQIWFGRF